MNESIRKHCLSLNIDKPQEKKKKTIDSYEILELKKKKQKFFSKDLLKQILFVKEKTSKSFYSILKVIFLIFT